MDLLWLICVHLDDQSSQELDKVRVIVVNAEVEAIEEGERVLLDVVGVFTDDFDDFKVHGISLLWLLFSQAIALLEPVGNFVMEVDLLPEFSKVLVADLVIYLVSDCILHGDHFNLLLHLVYYPVSVKVIHRSKARWILLLEVCLVLVVISFSESQRFNTLIGGHPIKIIRSSHHRLQDYTLSLF